MEFSAAENLKKEGFSLQYYLKEVVDLYEIPSGSRNIASKQCIKFYREKKLHLKNHNTKGFRRPKLRKIKKKNSVGPSKSEPLSLKNTIFCGF